MLSTLVHIKDKNELKIIVPFVFHFNANWGWLNRSKSGNFWNGRCGYSNMWSPGYWSLPWEWSARLSAVESNCSSPYIFYEHCNAPFSHSLNNPHPPPNTTQTIIAIFQSGDFDIISSHLALRTLSVFLILTKINLLFSRWILRAWMCCVSHMLLVKFKCYECHCWTDPIFFFSLSSWVFMQFKLFCTHWSCITSSPD